MSLIDTTQTLLNNYRIGNEQKNAYIFSATAVTLLASKDLINKAIEEVGKRNQGVESFFYYIEDFFKIHKNGMEQGTLKDIIYLVNWNQLSYEGLKTLFQMILAANDIELRNIIDTLIVYDSNLVKDSRAVNYIINTPWINSLVFEILKCYAGHSLLNTDCGEGLFTIKATEELHINQVQGYTANSMDSTIGMIRASILNKPCDIQTLPLFSDIGAQKFDMIYVSYPFIIKYDREVTRRLIDNSELDSYQIYKLGNCLQATRHYSSSMLSVLNMLCPLSLNGVLVAIVPEGGLVNSIDKDIRRYLVENNYLDTIISLPAGIITSTGVKTSLLIIRKNRHTGSITMIDAENICERQRRHVSFSDRNIQRIISLLKDPDKYADAMLIDRSEIKETDYNLNIDCYINMNNVLFNPCYLDDLCKEIFRGYQLKAAELDDIVTDEKDSTEYRIVTMADIQPEGFVSSDLQAVIVDNPEKFEKYCIQDGDILITAKNTTVKIAIYQQRDDCKVILTGNLLAIRVDQQKVSPYYLMTYFNSDICKAVIKSIQTGTTLKTISPNNLRKMKVSMIPEDMQEKLAHLFREKLNEVETLLNKYVEVSHELENIYNNHVNVRIGE